MHTTEVSDFEGDYEHAAPAAPKAMPKQIAAKKNKYSMMCRFDMCKHVGNCVDQDRFQDCILTGTMSQST